MTTLSHILERKEQRRRRLEENLPHLIEQVVEGFTVAQVGTHLGIVEGTPQAV